MPALLFNSYFKHALQVIERQCQTRVELAELVELVKLVELVA